VPWATFAVLNSLGVGLTVVAFGLAAHLVGSKTIDSPWFHEMVGGAFILGTVFTIAFIAWNVYRTRCAQAASADKASTQQSLAEAKSTAASSASPAD
jgi:hypothetical protein